MTQALTVTASESPQRRLHSDDVGVLVGAIVDNAHRLGLKWLIRPGTVMTGTDPSNVHVKVDGDDVDTSGVTSMVGALIAGTRVFLLIVPGVGIYVVGRVGLVRTSGQRVGTSIVETNSPAITTTETVVQTVTTDEPLVLGAIYRVRYSAAVIASAATTNVRVRIREDSLTGTIRQTRIHTTGPDTGDAAPVAGEMEFTAVRSDIKTFVVTIQRETGAGSFIWQAGANNAGYLYVDYIRG